MADKDNNGAPKGDDVNKDGVKAGVDGGDQDDQTNTVEYWREKAEYNAKELKKAAKQRDEYKAKVKVVDTDEDTGKKYKELYEENGKKLTTLTDKVRSSDIASAATSRLTKAGVKPDAMEAAISLLDKTIVEWNEEDGVDDTSVTAAVQKLKSKHGFLFEVPVNPKKPATPADGKSTGDDKTMTRSEFFKLPALEQTKRIREKWKVVND